MPLTSLMIGALAGSAAKFLYDVDQSSKIEEQAARKYAKAFEKSQEAKLLIQSAQEHTELRLQNVIKKKRAILDSSLPRFQKVYGKIQEVIIKNKPNDWMPAVSAAVSSFPDFGFELALKDTYTEKQLLCGIAIKGLGEMFIKDSEQYLSAAGRQMKLANVTYSQAESVAAVYKAVADRADMVSNLLMKYNALFMSIMKETEQIIEKNGVQNVSQYNQYDISVLMTCVNFACAAKDFIQIPILNEEGELEKEAEQLICLGKEKLELLENMKNREECL